MPAERLRDDRARTLSRVTVEIPVDLLDRPRISSDHDGCKVLDDSGQPARRAVRVGDLGPADQSVVGRRLEEDPGTPAGVTEERLEPADLHGSRAYGWNADVATTGVRRF